METRDSRGCRGGAAVIRVSVVADDTDRIAMSRVAAHDRCRGRQACTRVGSVNDDSAKDLRPQDQSIWEADTGLITFGVGDDMSQISRRCIAARRPRGAAATTVGAASTTTPSGPPPPWPATPVRRRPGPPDSPRDTRARVYASPALLAHDRAHRPDARDPTFPPRPASRRPAHPRRFPASRRRRSQRGEWPAYAGTYASARYSPLEQSGGASC